LVIPLPSISLLYSIAVEFLHSLQNIVHSQILVLVAGKVRLNHQWLGKAHCSQLEIKNYNYIIPSFAHSIDCGTIFWRYGYGDPLRPPGSSRHISTTRRNLTWLNITTSLSNWFSVEKSKELFLQNDLYRTLGITKKHFSTLCVQSKLNKSNQKN
jgi:hypothetical protein